VSIFLFCLWLAVTVYTVLAIRRFWNAPIRGLGPGYVVANMGSVACTVSINGSPPFVLEPGMKIESRRLA
jgi:hypothetical protein